MQDITASCILWAKTARLPGAATTESRREQQEGPCGWRAEPGPGAQTALPTGRGVDGRPAGGREGLQPGNDRFFPGEGHKPWRPARHISADKELLGGVPWWSSG